MGMIVGDLQVRSMRRFEIQTQLDEVRSLLDFAGKNQDKLIEHMTARAAILEREVGRVK